jgi:WD40 repeat protein
VWDIQGNQLAVCRGHQGDVFSVCATADNKIVSGSRDSTVLVWDIQGNQLAVCRGHQGAVFSVCVTSDNKIVSGSHDGTIRVWDMQGNQLAVCRGHERQVLSVCVTGDNKIVSGSGDKTIRVWDMQGNQLEHFCKFLSIKSLSVTADNNIVFGVDQMIVINDFQGNQLSVCKWHEGIVRSVCVTGDNKIIAAASNRTVKIWDIQGRAFAVCRGHRASVESVCLTADNNIVSGSEDFTVRVWDTEKLTVLEKALSASFSSFEKRNAIWELIQEYYGGTKDRPKCYDQLKGLIA